MMLQILKSARVRPSKQVYFKPLNLSRNNYSVVKLCSGNLCDDLKTLLFITTTSLTLSLSPGIGEFWRRRTKTGRENELDLKRHPRITCCVYGCRQEPPSFEDWKRINKQKGLYWACSKCYCVAGHIQRIRMILTWVIVWRLTKFKFKCNFQIRPYLQTNQGRASNTNPKCRQRYYREKRIARLGWGDTSSYDDASEAFNVSFVSPI